MKEGEGAHSLSTLVVQIAQEIIEQKMGDIHALLHEHVSKEINKVVTARVEDKLRGEPGTPGTPGRHAQVDVKTIAREAAKLIPRVNEQEMLERVLQYVPDSETVAQRVAEIMPPTQVIHGTDGEDGDDGSPDNPAQIIEKIHSLKEPIKIEAIKGLDKFLRNLQRAVQEKAGGKMIHGGGMTIKAGAGQTLTRNTDGTWSLTTTSGFTSLAATETPNEVLTVFTFSTATAQPSFIIVDNVWMRATTKKGTVNWTWNSGTKKATLAVPPVDEILGIV